MGMLAFHVLFPDEARNEGRTVTPVNHDDLPGHTFLFVEAYCADRRCDCRRVMINVVDTEAQVQVATINHGFEPPEPPFEDEGQTFLDPLGPQTEMSGIFLKMFTEMMGHDGAYRDRLLRHYKMWKRVVDDPLHPAQAMLEKEQGFGMMPKGEPVRRTSPKVGMNDPCPCGSGRKYKKCCRA